MHGCAHAGAYVGRARGHDSDVRRLSTSAWNEGFYDVDESLESVEDCVEQVALLHAHNAQVVFFAQPHDALLVFRVLAAAAVRPVSSDAGVDQEGVGRHVLEHDVSVDVLLLFCSVDEVLVSRGDGHLLAALVRVCDQLVEDLLHVLLHGHAVVASHSSRERVLLQVASGAHAHGKFGESELGEVQLAVFREAFSAGEVPRVDVLGLVEVHFVVLLEHALEERLEVVLVVRAHRVDTDLGVRILHSGVHAAQHALLLLLGEGLEPSFIELLDADAL